MARIACAPGHWAKVPRVMAAFASLALSILRMLRVENMQRRIIQFQLAPNSGSYDWEHDPAVVLKPRNALERGVTKGRLGGSQ